MTRGILFKYAIDKEMHHKQFLYGDHYPNHANAMKAGKNLDRLSMSPDICDN